MLRNLNKDMLIKLVETIGRNKQKRIDELENLIKIYQSVTSVWKCETEGCKVVEIEGCKIGKLQDIEVHICYSCGQNKVKVIYYETEEQKACENHCTYRMGYFYCTKC
jgi:hypothetical protein